MGEKNSQLERRGGVVVTASWGRRTLGWGVGGAGSGQGRSQLGGKPSWTSGQGDLIGAWAVEVPAEDMGENNGVRSMGWKRGEQRHGQGRRARGWGEQAVGRGEQLAGWGERGVGKGGEISAGGGGGRVGPVGRGDLIGVWAVEVPVGGVGENSGVQSVGWGRGEQRRGKGSGVGENRGVGRGEELAAGRGRGRGQGQGRRAPNGGWGMQERTGAWARAGKKMSQREERGAGSTGREGVRYGMKRQKV